MVSKEVYNLIMRVHVVEHDCVEKIDKIINFKNVIERDIWIEDLQERLDGNLSLVHFDFGMGIFEGNTLLTSYLFLGCFGIGCHLCEPVYE